jgi:hypothetical protein
METRANEYCKHTHHSNGLGQTEITHLDLSPQAQQHIGWLHVWKSSGG